MVFIYRQHRIQLVPNFVFSADGGSFQVTTESWDYRIGNTNGTVLYDSSVASPATTEPFANAAMNAAIAWVNLTISAGETAPTRQPLGSLI